MAHAGTTCGTMKWLHFNLMLTRVGNHFHMPAAVHPGFLQYGRSCKFTVDEKIGGDFLYPICCWKATMPLADALPNPLLTV